MGGGWPSTELHKNARISFIVARLSFILIYARISWIDLFLEFGINKIIIYFSSGEIIFQVQVKLNFHSNLNQLETAKAAFICLNLSWCVFALLCLSLLVIVCIFAYLALLGLSSGFFWVYAWTDIVHYDLFGCFHSLK